MKKYIMVLTLLTIVTIINACSVNADAAQDITYPTLNELTMANEEMPYRIEFETVEEALAEPEVVEQEASHVVSGGAEWIYAKTQDGVQGTKTSTYKLTYNMGGDLLSRVLVPDATTHENTTPTIYEGGQAAQSGAYYYATRITRYGSDCDGCNVGNEGKGSTSAGIGIGVDSVRQKDGSWKDGITYEGYYVIATSSSIPLCTVVSIKNHTVSGAGITPGVPFKAIVLDRGGAITGSKIDLFAGSELNFSLSQGRIQDADVEILSLNTRYNSGGQWDCAV